MPEWSWERETPVLTDPLIERTFSPSGAEVASGRVEQACWLSTEIAVVSGWRRADNLAGPPPSTCRSARATAVLHRLERDAEESAALRFLAVVDAAVVFEGGVLDVGGVGVEFDLELELLDPETLARAALSGADSSTRDRAVVLVATAASNATGAPSSHLAHQLRLFRDGARIPLAHCEIARDLPQGLYVDSLYRVDERSFYIRGWQRDTSATLESLVVVAPEGARAELAGNLVRYSRADVEDFYGAGPDTPGAERTGFVAYFELASASCLVDGWVLEMRNDAGEAVEYPVPPVIEDRTTLRVMVLNDLAHETPNHEALYQDHAFPCLAALQDRAARQGAIEAVTQFGSPPLQPEVSIIVPLYGRIDFVEHQLAQFVDDPDFKDVELIYVLDSPELADSLGAAAPALFELYGVAFRTVTLRHNLGFAGANAQGVSCARGRLLLLLNSDVIPDRPGWLTTMTEFHDRTPRLGAVGPKLIYEDESIQHAGMFFSRVPGTERWENIHYFKGLHRSFAPANATRIVPAITGACLLISRHLWDLVGGFKGVYVQGDFEDSDLCLRIKERGFDSWYLAEVELYHLEGQSYPSPLRQLTTRFNSWLHTYLWGEQITVVMGEFEAERPRRATRRAK
ncbi:MAG: putative glycosyl transferase, family 2 [Acidimicrobiaceae bacterium]|nr:putative glycosyl transferase, family 2 [Acidimicrobiaceae bacterium]